MGRNTTAPTRSYDYHGLNVPAQPGHTRVSKNTLTDVNDEEDIKPISRGSRRDTTLGSKPPDGTPAKRRSRTFQEWMNELEVYSITLSSAIAEGNLRSFIDNRNQEEEQYGDCLVEHLGEWDSTGEPTNFLEKILRVQIKAAIDNAGTRHSLRRTFRKKEITPTGLAYLNPRKDLIQYVIKTHHKKYFVEAAPYESPVEAVISDMDEKSNAPRELIQLIVANAGPATATRINSWFDGNPLESELEVVFNRLVRIISTPDELGVSALKEMVPHLTLGALGRQDEDGNTILHAISRLNVSTVGDDKLRSQFKSLVETIGENYPGLVRIINYKGESPYQARVKALLLPGSSEQQQGLDEVALYLKRQSISCDPHRTAMQLVFGSTSTHASYPLNLDLGYLTDSKIKQPILKTALLAYLELLNFGDMLKYVRIPYFQLKDDEDPQENSKFLSNPEIIFDFLKKRTPKVQAISEVIVYYSAAEVATGNSIILSKPDTNATIRCCLEPFGEYLEKWNWKKVDICTEMVHGVAPNLRVLHLYTSGNNAVLGHWAGPNGIEKFEKLREVFLTVCASHVVETRAEIANCVEKFVKTIRSRPNISVHYNLTRDLGGVASKGDGTAEGVSHDHTREHAHVASVPTHQRGIQIMKEDVWLENMQKFGHFVGKFRRQQSKVYRQLKPKPIRVAVLDDGFTLIELMPDFKDMRNKLFAAAFDAPFTDQGATQFPMTEYYSETGHGTLMTKLIHMICPEVEFYIAKLAQVEKGPHTAAAVKAIEWARSKKVDIISMSWTIKSNADRRDADFKELEKVLGLARDDGILMYGAATDEGANLPGDQYVLPGFAQGVFFIGAADTSGNSDRHVEKGVDFILPGGNQDKYRGSSYATALAAGLAALILHCAEITGFFQRNPRARDTNWESGMRKIWTKMSAGEHMKYVQPSWAFQVEKFNKLAWTAPETYEAFTRTVEAVLSPVQDIMVHSEAH